MSIESEIERIENNISDAYDAMEAAGAEIPTDRNSNNLTMTVSNALSNSAGQAYRKLTESLYNEAITYGTYDDKTIENGEIFTAYDGTFKKYTSEISGVTRGDTYETFGTFPDTSSTTGPGYLAYGNGILVASYTGNIPYWISSNNGQTWQKIENSNKVSNVVRFYNGYFYTSLKSNNINKLHKSEDAINWTPVSSDARFISYILNDTFVANYAYSKDYGVTWTNFPISTSGRSDLAFNNVVDNTYFCSFTNNSTSTFHLYWTEDFTNWNDISSFADNATRVDAICKFNNTYYMWYGYDEYTSHCILVTSTDRLNWTYVATYTNWANTLGYSGTVVLSYPNYTIQNNNSSSSTSSTPEMLEEGVVTKLSYHRGVLILNDYMYFIYGKTNNEQTFIGYPIIASYSRQCTSLSYNTSGVNNLIPTIDQSYSGVSTNAQSGIAVKQAVDEAISSVYKPAGSIAFSGLPTLSASYEGYVYNINEEFTTNANFVEGAGKTYPAGTNVVCIDVGSSTYKWDVLAGYIAPTHLTDLARAGTGISFTPVVETNYSVVGNPTISDGVASGFSTGNYLTLPASLKNNTYTFVTKFTIGSNITTEQTIVHNEEFFALEVLTDGKLSSYNWGTSSNVRLFSLSANTTYWIKCVFSGTTKALYSSTDGSSWTAITSFTDSSLNPSNIYSFNIGLNSHNSGSPFLGSVDLTECYATDSNGTLVWSAYELQEKQEISTDALRNTATNADSLAIGGITTTGEKNTYVGITSNVTSNQKGNVAIGSGVTASSSWSVAIGQVAKAQASTVVAIGSGATASGVKSVSIGGDAKNSGDSAILLGPKATNTEAQTFKVSLNTTNTAATDESGGLYTLLNSSGKIPLGRLPLDTYIKKGANVTFEKPFINVERYGNDLVINNGVISNFTTSSYVSTINAINLQRNFELYIKVNSGTFTSCSTNSYFIGSETNWTRNIILGFNKTSKKLALYLSSDGKNSDICSSKTGTYVFSENTDYKFKLTFDGSYYKAYYSLDDGETWIEDISVTSNTYLATNRIDFYIHESRTNTAPSDASIDFSQTFITSNGSIIWQGLYPDAYGISSSLPRRVLDNIALGQNSLSIGGTASGNTSATNVGILSSTGNSGTVALGYNAKALAQNSTAIGCGSEITAPSSIAIGQNAKSTATQAFEIGPGTNSDHHTLRIGFFLDGDFVGYTLLDGNTGKIPMARLPFQKVTENNTALTSVNDECSWVITHNLNTRDVTVSVYNLTTNIEPLYNIEHTTVNTVTITFNSSVDIAADSYRAVIIG